MIVKSVADGGLSSSGIKYITTILFYGHENWCLGIGDCPVLIKRSEVYQWVEDIYSANDEKSLKACLEIMEAYKESAQYKKFVSVGEAEEAKKKTIPAPSVGEMSEPLQPALSESATESITVLLPSNTTN